jgi:hypothetical protein
LTNRIKIDPGVLVPNAIALVFHILIVIFFGLGISGEHANVMALSSIWAVLICLRSDVAMLLAPKDQSDELFLHGVGRIVVLSSGAMLIGLVLDDTSPFLNNSIIACGGALALNELTAALYLKENKMWGFVLIKSIPYPMFLISLILETSFTVADLWLLSLCIGLAGSSKLSLIVLGNAYRTKKSRRAVFFKNTARLVTPTLTTFAAIVLSNIAVVLITELYGTIETGVWINWYRALFLPLFYLSTAVQISMAKALSTHNKEIEVLTTVLNTWKPIERIASIYIALVMLSLVLFKNTVISEEHHLPLVISALLFGLLRMYTHFLTTAMQAVGKTHFVLFALGLELSALTILTFVAPPTVERFYILLSAYGFLFFLFHRLLLFSMTKKQKNLI